MTMLMYGIVTALILQLGKMHEWKERTKERKCVIHVCDEMEFNSVGGGRKKMVNSGTQYN